MATLFLARRSGAAGFSRHVAIKVVHPHLAEDPSFIRMFVDEALLSARIQHPNVVHVEELGEEQGTYFLVMEYVHGSALSTLLGTLARQDRRLSPELAVHIAMKVADGLDAAHELVDEKGTRLGVVHRDVSPQNVLLSAAGHVKLIDFGIAKASGQGRRTETGSLKGKVRYMSPEQAFGQSIDRRTDIYALAIVLWEMLTMQRLFKGANDLALLDEVRDPKIVAPSEYSPEIPPALDRVLLSALSKSADARPRTARDFRQRLQEAFPAAAAVGEERLGEVVRAVLGEHIEMRKLTLPDSMTGLSLRALDKKSDIARSEILRTMTVSAPGAAYMGDQEMSEPLLPSAVLGPAFVGAPAAAASSTPAGTGPSTARWLALGATVVALAGAATAGLVVLASSDGPAPPAASLVAPTPPPTSIGAPPPTTLVAIPSTPSVEADAGPAPLVATGEDDSATTHTPRGSGGRGGRGGRGHHDRVGAGMGAPVESMEEEDDGVMRIRTGGVTIYDDEF